MSAPTSVTTPIGLVPEHVAGRQVRSEHPVQVQVRAADRGRGDRDDRVVRLLDPRVGHVGDPYVQVALPCQCPHESLRPSVGEFVLPARPGRRSTSGSAGIPVSRPGRVCRRGRRGSEAAHEDTGSADHGGRSRGGDPDRPPRPGRSPRRGGGGHRRVPRTRPAAGPRARPARAARWSSARATPPSSSARPDELRAAGAEVTTVACDVTDEATPQLLIDTAVSATAGSTSSSATPG